MSDADALIRGAMEALFEVMSASAWIVDLSGRIVRENTHAKTQPRAPGVDRAPATLRDLWDATRPTVPGTDSHVPFVMHPGMRALSGRQVDREPFLVRVADRDEPLRMELSAVPVRDASGAVTGVLLLQCEVVDESRIARQLEQLVHERSRDMIAMEEARSHDRRLSAVGQLAAGVMHDVNNALNPIMAAAYLLRHHAESPEAVRDYAERIRMAAETGAATASRVGRFIRQEPVHAGGDELVDLSSLASEVMDLTQPMRLRRTSESNAVHVACDLAPAVPTRGVPGEIREALLNLVQNAIDAMPDGGMLTVRTFVDGGEACVAIRDNGTGMSRETREHAFEPFFTTKGAGGSGLGLAEVYGIARRHRGSATIDSEPGSGTTVTLRFPLERSAPVEAPPEAPEAPPEPLHVLVVEDHDDGREFLRRLLRTEGHTVDTARSCAEARERLASTPSPPYHLMLTDVGLPDGSGWDLAAYARALRPTLRIGVITGWEPMVSSGEARGVEFVLRKPLRAAELLSHIAGRKTPASRDT